MTTDSVRQAGRRRGRRLAHRRHGQGRRHARPPAGHHARGAHHRRGRARPPTSTPRCAAATRVSFDRLDSDGCMSTNDTVTLMASGASGHHARRCRTSPRRSPRPAPTWRCSCCATPRAPTTRSRSPSSNAASEDDAVEVGRSVARSNLFKAAVFGNDPNWGRVLASIGTTAAAFDPADLDVAMNGVWVCRRSTPAADPATVDLTPPRGDRHHRPQGRRASGPRCGPTT